MVGPAAPCLAPIALLCRQVLTRFDCVYAWFQTADIDEKSIRRDNPDDLVMVLAEAKVETNFSVFHLFFFFGKDMDGCNT